LGVGIFLRRSAHPPHRISHVIGDEQRSAAVDSDADGASIRISFVGEKPGEYIDRIS
jgi:hypothetical protein